MTRLLSLVAVMGASACVGSSGFLAYTNIGNKLKRGREEREEEDKIRGRLEKKETKAKYSKEANESAQGERDEAKRIEKESSEWATMLNNFMVAQTFKGDVAGIVNSGVSDVPEELIPHVVDKLKKRNTKKWQFCPNWSDDVHLDPLNFRALVHLGYPITKEMWELYFDTSSSSTASAFEMTKCYEDKTKGLPDFYSLNGCDRNKRMKILEECGGPRAHTCACDTGISTKKARFILTNEYAEDGCKGEVVHELMLNPGAKLGAKLPQQSLRGMDACCAQIENMKVESLDAKIGRSDPRIITLRDLDVQNKKVINLTKIEPIPGGEHVICSEDFNATLTISQ